MSVINTVKTELIEKFNSILEILIEDYDFQYVLNDLSTAEVGEWFDEYEYDINSSNCGFKIDSGATRLVIIPDDLDWVIKMPMELEDEYCKKEELVYNESKIHKEKLDRFFAECFCLGYFHNIPFYAMRKAIVNEVIVYSDYDRIVSNSNSNSNLEEIEYNDVVETLFRDYYSNDIIDVLCDFCKCHKVTDIHSSNIGYSDNGDLIIIDYGGYSCPCVFSE